MPALNILRNTYNDDAEMERLRDRALTGLRVISGFSDFPKPELDGYRIGFKDGFRTALLVLVEAAEQGKEV